jgi:hypothetical protein
MVSDIVRKSPVYWSKALTLVFACSILFLDSLRTHDGEQCAAPIRDWLNIEWKRLEMGKMGNNKTPFINDLNMPMLTPRGKFSDCDCYSFQITYSSNTETFCLSHQFHSKTTIAIAVFSCAGTHTIYM